MIYQILGVEASKKGVYYSILNTQSGGNGSEGHWAMALENQMRNRGGVDEASKGQNSTVAICGIAHVA